MAPDVSAGNWREEWAEFVAAVEARLKDGEREYGNSAAMRPVGELFDELEQELLDISGWGYWLWLRMRKIRADIESLDAKLSTSRGATGESESGSQAGTRSYAPFDLAG